MKSKENHSQSPLLSAHIKTGFYVILPCMAGAFSISFNSLHYMIFFFMSVLDSLSLSFHFFSFFHSASLDTFLTLLLLIFRGHRLYKKIKMKKKWKRKTCCKASACLNENLNILYGFFFFLTLFPNLLFYVSPRPGCLDGNFFYRFWINFGLGFFDGLYVWYFWIIYSLYCRNGIEIEENYYL